MHVFEGQPDARQSNDVAHKVSRFRPTYRALTDTEKQLHDAIKARAADLESLFEKVMPGREASLGMTKLEEAVMWAVKGLTGAGMKPLTPADLPAPGSASGYQSPAMAAYGAGALR